MPTVTAGTFAAVAVGAYSLQRQRTVCHRASSCLPVSPLSVSSSPSLHLSRSLAPPPPEEGVRRSQTNEAKAGKDLQSADMRSRDGGRIESSVSLQWKTTTDKMKGKVLWDLWDEAPLQADGFERISQPILKFPPFCIIHQRVPVVLTRGLM